MSQNKVRLIVSGMVSPPRKRDLGAKVAQGKYLAFIDDDAYPCKEWLSTAIDSGEDIISGPSITPKEDSFMQKLSGKIYEVMACKHKWRYKPSYYPLTVDEAPSCNLVIRKDVFWEVNGFRCSHYPGEDSFLCFKLKRKGYDIVQHPTVLVYHHRRGLRGHIKQIANYGYVRGWLARQGFCGLSYFMPALIVIGLTLSVLVYGMNFIIGFLK